MAVSTRRAAILVALLAIVVSSCSQNKTPHAKPKVVVKPMAIPADAKVLYLHTEFLPYKGIDANNQPYRLSREIIRQAVLVAARDEMGLQTCDETLRESPPDDAACVAHLNLTERCNVDGKWHVKLTGYAPELDPIDADAIWEKTYDCETAASKIYADIIPKLEVDTRGEFVEALKKAGLKNQKPAAAEPKEKASSTTAADAEPLLLNPDFITQFGAVRAAHQAVGAGGQSREWLPVLARGYANLATLTSHHWNSATEVFTARAWLYAQRAVAAENNSADALWNRAYAWALGGAFQHALADVDRAEKLGTATKQAKDSKEAAAPSWTKLVKPFANFDRAGTKEVGADETDLKPWATCLYFTLTDFTRYSHWIYAAASEAGGNCPMAYVVFDSLAHHGGLLGVTRMGASYAPASFAHFAPMDLAKIPGLPQAVKDAIPTDEKTYIELNKQAGDPNPNDGFSAVPGYFAQKLSEHARQHSEGDASWSILASLLEEEQFVEAANYMNVSTNATETNLQDEIDSVMPLIKNHPYAPYVDSFKVGNRRDPGELFGIFGNMPVRDPRMNSIQMFSRIGYLKDGEGNVIGTDCINHCGRNFTVPGLVEYLFPYGSNMGTYATALATDCAKELQAIAPGSSIGTRILIEASTEPKAEELKAWEEELSDDPTAFSELGERYLKLKDEESAQRCFERSLVILPTSGTTIKLSNLYRDQGDNEKWEKTLSAFLETPDLGLEHAQIQQQLALGLAHRGEWKKAKPHAVVAGETYSAWGLQCASYVCEGLGEWDESEKWIRAACENYPSGCGDGWYRWCKRNGRGDLKAAEALADNYLGMPNPHPTIDTNIHRAAHYVLKGNSETALTFYNQVIFEKRGYVTTCMIADIARQRQDGPARAEVIDLMEKEFAHPAEGNVRIPQLDEVGLLIVDLAKNGNPTPERLAHIDELMLALPYAHREIMTVWSFLIGNELEALGKKEEAEKYWRRCLIQPVRNADYSDLAGAKLAALHNGPARPDDDVLTPADLWPQPK
jgi:tetratricopeptide (TPR) repeat protein